MKPDKSLTDVIAIDLCRLAAGGAGDLPQLLVGLTVRGRADPFGLSVRLADPTSAAAVELLVELAMLERGWLYQEEENLRSWRKPGKHFRGAAPFEAEGGSSRHAR